jgi:formate hydrogenlyase subunit 4
MKTLKRLALSALLVGLAVLSTAVAGSAYGGIATSRSAALLAEPIVVAETPHRVFVCRVVDDAVAECAEAR